MYKEFSKVYDEFMEYADYDKWYEVILTLMGDNFEKESNFLDLGCGTGEVLLRAVEDFNCEGVDLSEGMLERAVEKLEVKKKHVTLYEQDMTMLNLEKKYKTIVSLFDTVNHLTTLSELDELFKGINKHLEKDGLYIFDVVDREFMEEMFPGGVFLDERENMTIIWEHFMEDGLDCINTTFFAKNESGSYDKYVEDYEKRIFTFSEIKESVEKNNLRIREVHENDVLAGRRFFYVIEKI